ncbi:unnamed protein product [Caenorhabditis brenneri]
MPLPLLRLPENLTVDVLRTFGMRELLAISILSKRANKAVKLLKLRSIDVNLHIGNSIKFELIFNDPTQNLVFVFYKNTKKRNTVLNIPKRVTVTSDGNKIEEWKFPSSKMTMEDWYYFIGETVGSCLRIYFKLGFTVFNFGSIKKTFKFFEFNQLSIPENIPDKQSRMIMEGFLPISDDLILEKENFRAILIQNHEYLSFGTGQRPSDLTLNDLLVCNFSDISIVLPTWTDSDMNRFLKLWMQGACRRLCRLGFFYLPGGWRWNQEEVLKGISYKEVEGDRILGLFNGELEYAINGGCDIRAMDGRICTIKTRNSHSVSYGDFSLEQTFRKITVVAVLPLELRVGTMVMLY